jgi:aspartokinase
MTDKPEDDESEILKGMFEEIMKMVQQKQIKIETIIQRAVEQGMISQDSFNRIHKILGEYGKKKQWM